MVKKIFKYTKKTYPYVKPYMKLNVISILLSQISAILILLNPLALKYLIDDILSTQNWSKLPIFAYAIIGIVAGSQITSFLSNAIYAKFSETVYSDARNALFAEYLKKNLSFFDKKSDGDLVSRLMQDSANIHVLLSYLLEKFVTGFIKIVAVLVIILSLNVKLALISIITIPVFLFLNKFFAKRIQATVTQVRNYQSKLTDFYITSFMNIKLIKNFCNEDIECRNGSDLNEKSKKIQIRTEFLGYFVGNTMGIVTSLNQLLVLVLGGIEISHGAMTIGGLIAFNTYLTFLYSPFLEITSAYTELTRSLVGLERFFEYYGEEDAEDYDSGIPCNTKDGTLAIEDLSFCYHPEKMILNNLHLNVHNKEKILLQGQSGNGKSTLISLLKHFYEVPDHHINIGGQEINSLNLRHLRSSIFYLSQENMFFSGNIRENFQRICPDITDEAIYQALEKVNMKDAILERGDGGLETTLQKNGGTFSGGQRQRLSLARTFIQSGNIVILDEPFTGIDPVTANKIWGQLKICLRDKTVIIVDHYCIEKSYFDRILKLDGGRIIASSKKIL